MIEDTFTCYLNCSETKRIYCIHVFAQAHSSQSEFIYLFLYHYFGTKIDKLTSADCANTSQDRSSEQVCNLV